MSSIFLFLRKESSNRRQRGEDEEIYRFLTKLYNGGARPQRLKVVLAESLEFHFDLLSLFFDLLYTQTFGFVRRLLFQLPIEPFNLSHENYQEKLQSFTEDFTIILFRNRFFSCFFSLIAYTFLTRKKKNIKAKQQLSECEAKRAASING